MSLCSLQLSGATNLLTDCMVMLFDLYTYG